MVNKNEHGVIKNELENKMNRAEKMNMVNKNEHGE